MSAIAYPLAVGITAFIACPGVNIRAAAIDTVGANNIRNIIFFIAFS
jgi:hypothetical protein